METYDVYSNNGEQLLLQSVTMEEYQKFLLQTNTPYSSTAHYKSGKHIAANQTAMARNIAHG